MTSQWVYKFITVAPDFISIKPEKIEAALNKLGKEGWELVSVVQTGMAHNFYLKKPV